MIILSIREADYEFMTYTIGRRGSPKESPKQQDLKANFIKIPK
jgi:hypothetical protein